MQAVEGRDPNHGKACKPLEPSLPGRPERAPPAKLLRPRRVSPGGGSPGPRREGFGSSGAPPGWADEVGLRTVLLLLLLLLLEATAEDGVGGRPAPPAGGAVVPGGSAELPAAAARVQVRGRAAEGTDHAQRCGQEAGQLQRRGVDGAAAPPVVTQRHGHPVSNGEACRGGGGSRGDFDWAARFQRLAHSVRAHSARTWKRS